MKIATIIGTKVEVIKLSPIIKKLDKECEHILIHTGQECDFNLNKMHFEEIDLRNPNYFLAVMSDTQHEEIGNVIFQVGTMLAKEKPNAVLVTGNSNSALSAMIAKRMRIPAYRLEAGERGKDDAEEINRKVIDHTSDFLFTQTEEAKEVLLKEGIDPRRIFVTGDDIEKIVKTIIETNHV